MKILVMVCFFLVFYLDSVQSFSMNDIVNNIPGWWKEPWLMDSISSVWSRIKIAIKKPVRARRLGSGGRKKSTTVSETSTPPVVTETVEIKTIDNMNVIPLIKPILSGSSQHHVGKMHALSSNDTVVEKPQEEEKTDDAEPKATLEKRKLYYHSILKLPYITEPIWKSINDWYEMQKPHFVKVYKERKNKDYTSVHHPYVEEREEFASSDEMFGILLFI